MEDRSKENKDNTQGRITRPEGLTKTRKIRTRGKERGQKNGEGRGNVLRRKQEESRTQNEVEG
ncbi:hypothetical protein E2C01_063375 [Portunus trituberculatus]|uniref:Uncharacterized protein n=1 Tax=Portunus trituberculatus TaxID=210409 RepID=A0A5B7HAA8_PORTR|nr:hypothetical protein [Portunus trituberculatus]